MVTGRAPVDAEDVAAVLLKTLGSMTGMKLQKLLYYVQAWHIARYGGRAFVDNIEAWSNGPVVRSIYRQHRKTFIVTSIANGDTSAVTGSIQDIVEWVVEAYGGFSAEQLSSMTHGEVPWLVARGGLPDDAPSQQALSDDLMGSFYARQTLSGPEAIESAAASAALEGESISYDWQQAVLDAAETPGGVEALIAQRLHELGVR